MRSNESVMRVFEVRARPGRAAELREKLASTSVAVVDGKPGHLGHYFGEERSASGDDLVFVSIWRDLASIRALFGEDWEQAFLPEGYEALIESCALRHFEVRGGLAAGPLRGT